MPSLIGTAQRQVLLSCDWLTRAATKTRTRSKSMRNAQYLRAQAEFCLEVARQMSDYKMVENLQAEAARYHAEAVEVETEHHPGSELDQKAAAPTRGAALRSK
jgi:hypothetical protein